MAFVLVLENGLETALCVHIVAVTEGVDDDCRLVERSASRHKFHAHVAVALSNRHTEKSAMEIEKVKWGVVVGGGG